MIQDEDRKQYLRIFQRRRQKNLLKKTFALPILSFKSQTEPFEQEVQLKQNRSDFFNPHFKLRKKEDMVCLSIRRRKQFVQSQSQMKKWKQGQQLAPKISNSLSFQHRKPHQSMLKSRVLAHIRQIEAREKRSPRNSVLFCPTKRSQRLSNNQKSIADSARTTINQHNFLRCSSLLNQSSPRKASKNLATIQVKIPIARKRFRPLERNDVSGWEIHPKWFQIDHATTGSLDLYRQNN